MRVRTTLYRSEGKCFAHVIDQISTTNPKNEGGSTFLSAHSNHGNSSAMKMYYVEGKY